jgi:glycosyltransferase involved in cell wall biosynthesis
LRPDRTDISIVVPDLFDGGGGIARIARATTLACHRFCRKFGGKLHVFVLNDSGEHPDPSYLPDVHGYRGFRSDRPALARAVLAQAWNRSHAGTIFCHVNLASLGLAFPSIGRGPGRRYSVVAHGVDVWEPLSFHRTWALRLASEVWPVSEYTASKVETVQGVKGDRVRVIHNCLDPQWPIGAASEPPADRYVLALSRLSRADAYKGVDTLIEAVARLTQAKVELQLRVVGSGEDLPRLQALARACGIADRVRFLGWQSDEEVRRLYEGCAFFALPSRKEGFGLVYLEAMAAGKAVIAASATAVPEIVLDGVTGLLVPYGDIAATAAALAELAERRPAARLMGLEGRKRVESRFTFARYQDSIERALAVLWRADVDWVRWTTASVAAAVGSE